VSSEPSRGFAAPEREGSRSAGRGVRGQAMRSRGRARGGVRLGQSARMVRSRLGPVDHAQLAGAHAQPRRAVGDRLDVEVLGVARQSLQRLADAAPVGWRQLAKISRRTTRDLYAPLSGESGMSRDRRRGLKPGRGQPSSSAKTSEAGWMGPAARSASAACMSSRNVAAGASTKSSRSPSGIAITAATGAPCFVTIAGRPGLPHRDHQQPGSDFAQETAPCRPSASVTYLATPAVSCPR
jgi:hypothetical protein